MSSERELAGRDAYSILQPFIDGLIKDESAMEVFVIQESVRMPDDIHRSIDDTYNLIDGADLIKNRMHFAFAACLCHYCIDYASNIRNVSDASLLKYENQLKQVIGYDIHKSFPIWVKQKAHEFMPELVQQLEDSVPTEDLPVEMYAGIVAVAAPIAYELRDNQDIEYL
jgi:hypothetical protein